MSQYVSHIILLFCLVVGSPWSVQAEDKLEIDFALIEGRILIDGHLNGRDGVFIFDTGTPQIIINDNDITSSSEYMSSVQGDHAVMIKSVDWIQISDYALPRHSKLLHMDLSGLLGSEMNKHVLGIIGWSAFDSDQPILINYRDSKIIIGKPEFTADMVASNHVIRLALKEVGNELPTIEIEMNKEVLTFAFDTGAPLHAIGAHASGQLRGDILHESIKMDGLVTIKDNVFRIENMKAFEEFDGILSVNALNTNYVVIDRSGERVYLFWDKRKEIAQL